LHDSDYLRCPQSEQIEQHLTRTTKDNSCRDQQQQNDTEFNNVRKTEHNFRLSAFLLGKSQVQLSSPLARRHELDYRLSRYPGVSLILAVFCFRPTALRNRKWRIWVWVYAMIPAGALLVLVVALFLNFGVLGLGLEFCFSCFVLLAFFACFPFGVLGGENADKDVRGPKVATWAFYMSE
jgi:hypothetical protein